MGNSGKIIDLFCGCGGLSLSAKMAGFDVSLSVDKDPTLTSSYPLNFPDANLRIADISKLSGDDLVRFAGGRPTGIVGGPPCQGFSAIGKRDKSDPRNDLVQHFFRLVAEIQPQFFLMENVPGLLFPGNVKKLMKAIKLVEREYEIVEPAVFDAADCGGATKRRRAIIVGYRSAMVDRPEFPYSVAPTSVKDAISDIPSPRPYDRSIHDWEWWKCDKGTRSQSDFARRAKREPPPGMGAPVAIKMLRNGFVTGCMETQHTEKVVRRFSEILQGECDPISRYPRLSWGQPGTTLRAGTGSDLGSFQAARPIHPTQNRVITVREAARLQGFPDWFLFHATKWHSFRMIGNSVSPDMGVPLMGALFEASTAPRVAAAE